MENQQSNCKNSMKLQLLDNYIEVKYHICTVALHQISLKNTINLSNNRNGHSWIHSHFSNHLQNCTENFAIQYKK